MTGFDAPDPDEVRVVIDGLLHEAFTLRSGTIPAPAIVEINMPPFVALCFEEMPAGWVIVEALDRQEHGVPVYLFPNLRAWRVPSTGKGPGAKHGAFDAICGVVAMMSTAALRDF